MPPPQSNPYAEFQQPAAGADPYAEFQAPAEKKATPIPKSTMEKIAGVNPISDTFGSIGSHLKNLVAGPYHALADAPRNQEEQQLIDEHGGDSNPLLGFANHLGLGVDRMFVQPTADALKESARLRAAGGPQSSLLAPSSYDEEGNNVPTAGSKIVDSIPIVGPWSRGYEDEVHQKGLLPATAGLATDAFAPKVIGKGISSGLTKIAPAMAERALRVMPADRAHGSTPGRFILDRTSGLSPESIESTGRQSMEDLRNEQGNLLAGSPGLVDLDPARTVAGAYGSRAVEENHPGTIKDVTNLAKQLDEDYTSKQPLARYVTPSRAASLNRGISNAHGSWNPATVNDTMTSSAGEMHHVLGDQIANVVPEVRPINQELQSGGSVLRRATQAGLREGIGGRAVSRLAAHTGALTAATAGLHAFGPLGGLAGLIGPEILVNPDVQVAAARGANAAAAPIKAAAPYFTIPSAQLPPPKRRDSPFAR